MTTFPSGMQNIMDKVWDNQRKGTGKTARFYLSKQKHEAKQFCTNTPIHNNSTNYVINNLKTFVQSSKVSKTDCKSLSLAI